MRILFINTIDNVGGAALIGWNLGKKLLEKGHDVKYLVGFKKSDDRYVYQLKKNFFLNYLTKKTDIDFNFIACGLLTKFLANDIDFGAEEEVLNHPWFKKSDIIHCNNLHGNYIKLKLLTEMSKTKKIIWTLHDEWAFMAHGSCILDDQDKVIEGFFRRSDLKQYPAMLWNNEDYLSKEKARIYKESKFEVVVPSIWLKDKVEKSLLGKRNINLVHHGIDISVFKQQNQKNVRIKLGLPLNKKIILFVANSGKNNPLKGWSYTERVINHFKDKKDLLFICIGGGNKDIKKTVPNIKYVPYVNDSSLLAQYYSSSDIFLFTSLVESFGLVAIEAMGCGLPIVGFPVGIIPEVVKHKSNGYIAQYKSSEDLIEGVKYMLNLSEENKMKISTELSEKIKKDFSLDAMTNCYLKIYRKLLDEN